MKRHQRNTQQQKNNEATTISRNRRVYTLDG